MKSIPKITKQVCLQILWWVVILCLVAVFVSASIQRLTGEPQPMILGWGGSVVLTGSMEPNVHVGSFILIHEKDDYSPGDVVTYLNESGRSVTHRVLSISGDTVVTKGDANNTADAPFDKSQIIGRVQLAIPGVGKVFLFLQKPIVIISMVIIAWGVYFLSNIVKRKAGHNDENELS